jgi:NADH dehydrogenase
VVIVGAGFAGLSLAQSLGSTPFRVTVVDRRNYHLFQPLLYQVATAVLTPGEIAEPVRRIMKRHRNVRVVLGELEGVDPGRREIRVNGELLRYDTLVLATGATHSYFGHPEWERFAPGLKTLEDARRIRARVLLAFEQAEMENDPAERERLMTFAIIGGGPTGVEMAGAIAGLARQSLVRDFRAIDPMTARILLIEAAPRILGPFPEDLSAYAERALKRLGVTILTGRAVENIDERGVTLGGEVIPAATVVWAAGVAASPVGALLNVGTDKAGRVRVNPDLSVPGLDGVYVLGDLALAHDEKGRPLPGLAQVAHQQGRYLGRALKAQHPARRDPSPVPVPQPGQPGCDRPQRGRGRLGQVQAEGLSRLACMGHRPRLPARRVPEPPAGEPALAMVLSDAPVWLPDHRRGCHQAVCAKRKDGRCR